MKLINTDVKKIPKSKSLYSIGMAIDSSIYYVAMVDINSQKNFVEEVSLSPSREKFTGVFREIQDEETWKKVSAFFNAAGLFEQFWKGKNWRWHRENGKEVVPDWFQRKYNDPAPDKKS